LDQGLDGDPELEEVEQQEPAALPVGLVEQEALVVLEAEVELAPSADLEALVDLGKNAEALAINGPRVDRVQSNYIGILEACPLPQ
jgi:hypothetical protein